MDYVPWPESGCSLSEARDRICGNFFGSQNPATGQRVNRNDYEFRELLSNKRLVALGREGSPDRPQFLDFETAPIDLFDWQESKVFICGKAYFDVRIYPILLAPIRAPKILPAPFSEIFKACILGDPEVGALAKRGMEKSPQYKNIFIEGCCTVHGIEEWAVCFERALLIGEVHPDPKKRSKFDRPIPDCIEIYLAAQALKHRYAALIGALRRGDIEAEGLAVNQNFPSKTLRSVWSHHKFYVDAAGDVYEMDEFCDTHKFGLIKRWTGLMLNWRSASPTQVVRPSSSEMFHVEPMAFDGVRRNPTKDGNLTVLGRPQTPTEASIEEACHALFANGGDRAIPVKVRDQRIITWQKENKKKVASPKSIYRFLRTRRAGHA